MGTAAALSAVGLLALSACGERPYPSPTHEDAPPPPPPAALMGAPDQASPYTAPPVVEGPAYAPPSSGYASSGAYDGGAVVAMMPIPNPGDPGSAPYYGGYHGHRHERREAYASAGEPAVISPYGEGHPAPGRHPAYAYTAPSRPAYTPPTYARPVVVAHATGAKAPVIAQTTSVRKVVKTTTVITPPKLPAVVAFNAKGIERKSAAIAAGAGVAAHTAKQAAQSTAKTVVQTYKAQTVAAPAAAPTGDRTARLATLQSALTDAVGKSAVLTAPASFVANQPVDVTLVLPAGFADTLRGEAQKDSLGDAAASVNMTALLSGDGFAVSPDDTQSAPLTAGQPTQFHWTVTAQPGAKGPLHADVGADLLGGGSDKLALGSVQKSADLGVKLTPRVIGASLLVLIAALVVAWLARGRGPTRSASARRAARRAARGGRPLDMTSEGPSAL